jgi:hypothetical protein
LSRFLTILFQAWYPFYKTITSKEFTVCDPARFVRRLTITEFDENEEDNVLPLTGNKPLFEFNDNFFVGLTARLSELEYLDLNFAMKRSPKSSLWIRPKEIDTSAGVSDITLAVIAHHCQKLKVLKYTPSGHTTLRGVKQIIKANKDSLETLELYHIHVPQQSTENTITQDMQVFMSLLGQDPSIISLTNLPNNSSTNTNGDYNKRDLPGPLMLRHILSPLRRLSKLDLFCSNGLFGIDSSVVREALEVIVKCCPDLEELSLRQTGREFRDLSSLKRLQKLKSLDLSACDCGPLGFESLSGIPHTGRLVELDISDTRATDLGLEHLFKPPSSQTERVCALRKLVISSNSQLTNATAKIIGLHCSQLEDLDIYKTSITSEGVRQLLRTCTKLIQKPSPTKRSTDGEIDDGDGANYGGDDDYDEDEPGFEFGFGGGFYGGFGMGESVIWPPALGHPATFGPLSSLFAHQHMHAHDIDGLDDDEGVHDGNDGYSDEDHGTDCSEDEDETDQFYSDEDGCDEEDYEDDENDDESDGSGGVNQQSPFLKQKSSWWW